MPSRSNLAKIIHDLLELEREGLLRASDVADAGTPEDIDAVMASLPEPTRSRISFGLHERYGRDLGPAERFSIIEGVTVRDVEAYLADKQRREDEMRNVRIPAVRAWLDAHPLTPRTEPFPREAVEALLARVEPENKAAWAHEPRGPRAHRLSSVVVDLMNALTRAEGKPVGSQGHAVAWRLLERALAEADGVTR